MSVSVYAIFKFQWKPPEFYKRRQEETLGWTRALFVIISDRVPINPFLVRMGKTEETPTTNVSRGFFIIKYVSVQILSKRESEEHRTQLYQRKEWERSKRW